MLVVYILYAIYLILYGIVSYAIIYHLRRYRLEGDASNAVTTAYNTLSSLIIIATIVMFVIGYING